MKSKKLTTIICLGLVVLFLIPLNIQSEAADDIPGEPSDPIEKYAVIVAGGASPKIGQKTDCGSSSSPYKGAYTLYNQGYDWTNYNINVDLSVWDSDASSDYIGVMFRYQNNNNYYRLRFKNDLISDYVYLEKFVGGTLSTIASTSITFDRVTWYTLLIQLYGNSISVFRQTAPNTWAQIFAVTDSSLTHGTVALYSCRCSGAWFDDVLVRYPGTFLDLDFERKYEGQEARTLYPGYPTVVWNEVNNVGTGDWAFTDSEEPRYTPFVEDQEDFYKECNDTYNRLIDNGYTVRYLSVDHWADPDNDKQNEVYDIATSSTIHNAFTWMDQVSDSNDQCLIYMFDHGGKGVFQEVGFFMIDNDRDGDRKSLITDYLYDDDIGSWIDAIDYYDVLIFVLELCYAGRFINEISAPNRIVVTSADLVNPANPWWNNGQKTDWPVFSKFFFERLDDGYSFAAAFTYAVGYVNINNQYYPADEKQYPMLDDVGNLSPGTYL